MDSESTAAVEALLRPARYHELTTGAGAGIGSVARIAVAYIEVRRPTLTWQREAAAVLLRELLSMCFPGRQAEWEFFRTAGGAPRLVGTLENDPALHVSFSHSGCWLAVAVTTEAGLGIDIESARPGLETASLAAYFGWSPEVAFPMNFYRRWTLWEAYTKCREGRLAAAAGPEFKLLCDPGVPPAASTWHAFALPCPTDVYATVVLRSSEPQVLRLQTLDRERAHPW